MTAEQLAISVKPDASRDWIDGFVAMYFKSHSNQTRCKPVIVYHKGLKVTEERSRLDASIYSGVSGSRISEILKNGGKSKSGYSFRYGKKELKSEL